MLSNRIFVLMSAVEKFDYDHGFRFSAYFYRSVTRNAFRWIKTAHKQATQFTNDTEGWLLAKKCNCNSSITTDQMLSCRYTLSAHRKAHSFQDLASELGIFKSAPVNSNAKSLQSHGRRRQHGDGHVF